MKYLTKTDFIKKAADRGHFAEKKAEAGAALMEAFCKADLGNRRNLLKSLVDEAALYAECVMGWSSASIETEFKSLLRNQLNQK